MRPRLLSRFVHTTRDDAGQATTEYALILLAAAVIAVLVIAWATAGGGAGRIGELFDQVFEGVVTKANTGSVADLPQPTP